KGSRAGRKFGLACKPAAAHWPPVLRVIAAAAFPDESKQGALKSASVSPTENCSRRCVRQYVPPNFTVNALVVYSVSARRPVFVRVRSCASVAGVSAKRSREGKYPARSRR